MAAAKRIILLVVIFLEGVSFAGIGSPDTVSTTQSQQPISKSFTSIQTCFPALARDEFKQSIDLNRLKARIDDFDLTVKSTLRFRRLSFLTPGGKVTHRLTIRAQPQKNQVFDYEMVLEKLDPAGGVPVEIEIPRHHRKNPKQSDISSYLYDADLKLEETSFVESKMNGHILVFGRHFTEVQDLELRDAKGSRTLTCENQKNLGVVCTCK